MKLLVVGEGSDEENLKKLASELKKRVERTAVGNGEPGL